MKTIAIFILSAFAMTFAVSGAHASLQGRDLDGDTSTFEAWYDPASNLTWLADANYAQTSGYDADGKMDWHKADVWAAQLNINGYDNWRLPKVSPLNGVAMNYTVSYDGSTDASYNYTSLSKEMAYLFHVTLGNASRYDTTGAVSGCYVVDVDHCFDHQGPFTNLEFPYFYWNDAAYAPTPAEAWAAVLDRGSFGTQTTNQEHRAWVVSDGDVGAVPEPETYVFFLTGLGMIAWGIKQRAR
ncbi:MAG: DUF1566 domain-containing protein [Thiobacillus sp.]|nr:DUF1566 domain-containing protein [Thiobacillus sp.]